MEAQSEVWLCMRVLYTCMCVRIKEDGVYGGVGFVCMYMFGFGVKFAPMHYFLDTPQNLCKSLIQLYPSIKRGAQNEVDLK